MTGIEHFLNGLRERFGNALTTLSDGTVQAVLRGRQRVTIAFDETARTATVITPVEAATRDLPAATLNDLLKRNFPDSRMAGSLLAAIPSEEVLVAINAVPLYSATPELLAGIAMAQAHAALDMSSWIRVSRAESADEDDEDEDDDFDWDSVTDEDSLSSSHEWNEVLAAVSEEELKQDSEEA
jgi:hypothetical protein